MDPTKTKLELKPVDWLASGIKTQKPETLPDEVHAMFLNRMKFKNFNSKYMSDLEKLIREQISKENSAQLRLDLAVLLIQNNTSIARLNEAKAQLATLNTQTLNSQQRTITHELNDTIKEFLSNSAVKNRPRLKLINWGIYNRCPLVCKGCYHIFQDNILSLEQCKAIVDKISSTSTDFMVLSGGDPLLWDNILDFCKYASSKGLNIVIDTVGYTIDKKLAQELAGLVYHIGIPLDGSSQDIVSNFRLGKKDLFDATTSALTNLSEAGIKVHINTTVSKHNIHDLENTAHFLKQFKNLKGWALYQFWPIRAPLDLQNNMLTDASQIVEIVPQLKKIIDIPIYARVTEKRACNNVFISSNGEVHTFDQSQVMPTLIIGDIKTQSLDEILKSPSLKGDSHKWEPHDKAA